jgi:hypothetical protein
MPASATPDLTLYYPFEDKRFADHCFLCGTHTAPDDTVLVFEEWLLARYGAAGQQIQLLDQSVQTFSQLMIPCCPTCRTQYVAPLEARVAAATAAGGVGLRTLDEKTLFLWLGKMFYGILVLELLNELNPLVKPQYPLSENGQMLRRLQAFFQTFQALRVPIVFEDFTPASIFVLETTAHTVPFEYDDDLTTMSFSIRLDDTVVMACFIDNGLLRQAMRRVYQDARRPLHPVQLAEFKARVYYGAHLLNVVPDYFPRPLPPGADHIIYDTLVDDITREIFNPWENAAYGQSLQEMWKRWQIPYTEIMRDPGRPLSYLYDDNGVPRTLEHFPGADPQPATA